MNAQTHSLLVNAMSCGHCVKAITEAVLALDPASVVVADLAAKRVEVQTTRSREMLVAALAEAGYDASDGPEGL